MNTGRPGAARAMLALLTLSAALSMSACSDSGDERNTEASGTAAPTAQTANGTISGRDEPSMLAFRGIPYASPPLGERRFAAPAPAADWQGTRDGSDFAPGCPQPTNPFSVSDTSEDCLYLNVYRPKADGSYPVMVWIHGGSLETGAASVYNPAPLVRRDVVVVTINYRLGILGFLAHPALSATSEDEASGNYGLMDQQAALEWVQANIQNFAGDPDNVTIFGESAGGLSVLSQLVRPSAAGLFDKAIVESGSYAQQQKTLAQAEEAGAMLAANEALDCPSTTDPSCLRALTPEQIIAAQTELGPTFIPNQRPGFPQSIATALATGQFNQVPVLEGANRDEYRLFRGLALTAGLPPVAPENYETAIASALGVSPAMAQSIAEEYPLAAYDSTEFALSAIQTDAAFSCNARAQLGWLSGYVTTYAYEFADRDAPAVILETDAPDGFDYGAAHAFEIQYIFGPTPETADRQLSDDQLALADTMATYWTEFARNGDPNPSSGVPSFWPAYNTTSDTFLSLVPPSPEATTTFSESHHCDFWAALPSTR